MSKSISTIDAQRYGLVGDHDFSAARNEAIIARTIANTEKNYEQKQKMMAEGIAERSDLVYSYIRSQMSSGKDMDITEYAGWENMKRLWGETRLQEMRQRAIARGLLVE